MDLGFPDESQVCHLVEAPQHMERVREAPRPHVPRAPCVHFRGSFGLSVSWLPLFFLKKRKQHQIILPAALPPEPNLSSCLHFSEVTNYVSGNCFLQGSNFCLHMRCPPPAEMLAALWPGWVIRRMSQGMASTLCQGNRFAACSEDKFFTRGKLWHEFLWKK